jgi:hypothetical protein
MKAIYTSKLIDVPVSTKQKRVYNLHINDAMKTGAKLLFSADGVFSYFKCVNVLTLISLIEDRNSCKN